MKEKTEHKDVRSRRQSRKAGAAEDKVAEHKMQKPEEGDRISRGQSRRSRRQKKEDRSSRRQRRRLEEAEDRGEKQKKQETQQVLN